MSSRRGLRVAMALGNCLPGPKLRRLGCLQGVAHGRSAGVKALKCQCTWPILCGYIREFNIYYCTHCRGDVAPDRVEWSFPERGTGGKI